MYNSFNKAMKARFGTKVYKLALDAGMTCPNRDGTVGTRGCIFCGEKGSGEFAVPCGDVREQIENAKKAVAGKIRDGKYIAYFQSFTNTYAPVSRLREIFGRAIEHPDVAALSVATRPDCLPDDVLELIGELNGIKPVWVELGLQTIHESTAEYIRRGYDLPCYDRAVKALKEVGAEVVTHMIAGLPGETDEMIYETAEHVGAGGSNGIKIHVLYVLKGTDLAEEYARGAFEVLSLERYTEILKECVRRLPPEIVIHRLTGDGAKKDLIAPMWSADKKRVLNYINGEFKRDGVVQGERLK
ncbi:MAG: TIGR01212 family radical SAM protein [Clostridiales bacterium]|nr:TIGR01212 family radical SAM protein [Clostridiales bacterium]